MKTSYKERIKAYLRCILARLLDQNRAPRHWWWPSEHRLEFSSSEEWQRQHDEVSHTLQRVMLTLLGYSFFCVLTLGAPDISLIASDATIDLPLVGTKVNYTGFLAIGPLVQPF